MRADDCPWCDGLGSLEPARILCAPCKGTGKIQREEADQPETV